MEKAYQKHAWIFLFVVGVFLLILGSREMISGKFVDPRVGENLTGKTWAEAMADPFATFLTRGRGLALLELGILVMTITDFGYRRGEKWAWYVLWTIPAFLLAAFTLDLTAEGRVWPIQLLLTIVSLIGLLLPYRKFFPRKP